MVVAGGEVGTISLMAVDEADISKGGDEDGAFLLIAKEEDDLDAVVFLRVEVTILIEVRLTTRSTDLKPGKGMGLCLDRIHPTSGSNRVGLKSWLHMPALLVRTMQNLASGVNRTTAGTRPSKFEADKMQMMMDGRKATPVLTSQVIALIATAVATITLRSLLLEVETLTSESGNRNLWSQPILPWRTAALHRSQLPWAPNLRRKFNDINLSAAPTVATGHIKSGYDHETLRTMQVTVMRDGIKKIRIRNSCAGDMIAFQMVGARKMPIKAVDLFGVTNNKKLLTKAAET